MSCKHEWVDKSGNYFYKAVCKKCGQTLTKPKMSGE